MYQIGTEQLGQYEQKKNKFAVLLNLAIEHGSVDTPELPLNQIISLRSQINRYRKKMRGNPLTDSWDLVTNTLVKTRPGFGKLRMIYEKDFWDAIDRQLSDVPIEPIEPVLDPGFTTDFISVPDTNESIGDALQRFGYAPKLPSPESDDGNSEPDEV